MRSQIVAGEVQFLNTTNNLMMTRRSQKEEVRRNAERNKSAKSVAELFHSHFRSAHSHEPVVALPLAPRQEDPATRDLTRQAIHFAIKQLREAGLHGISISGGETTVTSGLEGFRRASIQSAAVRLSASTPYTDGTRVASRSFDLNLTYSGGKFSLDSAERLGQVFPINRDSLRRIISLEGEEKKPDFNLPKKERNLTKEEIRKEKERLQKEWDEKREKREALDDPSGIPSSEGNVPSVTEFADYVDPHENMDANEDVKRHGGGQVQKFCFSVPTRDGRTYAVWKQAPNEEQARKFLADEIGEEFAKRSKLTSPPEKKEGMEDDEEREGKSSCSAKNGCGGNRKKGQAVSRNPFQEGMTPKRVDPYDAPPKELHKQTPEEEADADFVSHSEAIIARIAELYSQGLDCGPIVKRLMREFPGQDKETIDQIVNEEVESLQAHSGDDVD